MTDTHINHRAQQVLKILVEKYIQEGLPVGSKTIAEESLLGLSAATIRNILSDLEHAGYLCSPHTSSGRVPTSMGYRLFVNTLLKVKPLTASTSEFQNILDPDMNTPHLLHQASSLLSGLTQMIGVVALPRRNKVALRQVEFLALSGNRVLVILVLNNRDVQNRIIYTDRVYSPSELQTCANYLNTHFVGKDLLVARKELQHAMKEDKENMAALLKTALEVANKAFSPAQNDHDDYVVAGQNNLLTYLKKEELEQLYDIFEAFTQKQDILNLLNQAIEAEGIQIFIGGESGYTSLDNCSIVTTSYSVDGELVGSLGVIGPIRMPYDKVISAVDVTSKLLSAALNHN